MNYAFTEQAFRKLICAIKDKIDNHKHIVDDVEDLSELTDEDIDNICTFEGDLEGGLIPIASKSNVGCVIIGDGINVRDDGTIWIDQVTYEVMTNSEIDSICT